MLIKPDTEYTPSIPLSLKIGDVAGLAVDAEDNLFLFNRGKDPIIVLDPLGNFKTAWGANLFQNPHGAHIGPDNCIYLTDSGDHTVRKFTLDGKFLLEIGIPGKPASFMSGEPFCKCTHSTSTPDGNILISDGYGNAAIHEYDSNGRYLKSWGSSGSGPGQFNLPHNICCDRSGTVYVADRENSRVQIFDRNGKFLGQINNMHRPSGLALTSGPDPFLIIGELASYQEVNKEFPNLGPFVSILNCKGDLIHRIGENEQPGLLPGQFVSPHCIALDRVGGLYVGDVAETDWNQVFTKNMM